MIFYEIDDALKEAIEAGDRPVRVQVAIDRGGYFEAVGEQDILEADFTGLKETGGGTSARGDVLLDNPNGIYSVKTPGPGGSGREVHISFSLGEGLPSFRRFVFYVDDRGFQDIRGPGRKKYIRLGLRDLSAKLRRTDENRDWTAPAVFTYSVICDKTQPERSLVHGIAQRAGLGLGDIDCATIPITLPYVTLQKNIWAELSDLAKTYRAHLECAPEKPLVFAHSPYQSEPSNDDEYSYTFTGEQTFYLRKITRTEDYRNTVRLKMNLPMALEKQEIWRYEDPPVLYDDYLTPRYPFRYPAVREIEKGGYEGRYRIRGAAEKERAVLFADHIDTKEEAENRLVYEGGSFSYAAYDITSHHDRALLAVQHDTDGDLYTAALYGRPIVTDLNRSCFMRDMEEIANHGTWALNVTGSYFSEDVFNGRPMYEDWAARELAERIRGRREFTVKTHRGLFHGRVGAKIRIETKQETMTGTVSALSLRYRKGAAFIATYKVKEEL